MRRTAGIGAIHNRKLQQEKYKDKGNEIQESQLEQMTKQLEIFRTNLEDFAAKHREEIRKNAQFRKQFQTMCAAIGVDPLASGKGFWSVLGIGDFYYELSVQIVEVCLATNSKNGGLIGLDELRERLIKARGKRKEHQDITNEDLLVAAKKLKIFGTGFTVIPMGKGPKCKYIVQSVPGELNLDHTAVLQQTSSTGSSFITVALLRSSLNWDEDRAQKALDHMVKQGLVWIDTQNADGVVYWFPSMFSACISSSS